MARYQVKPPEPTYVEAVRLPDWVRSMRLTRDEKNLGDAGLWQFPVPVDGVCPDIHEALWLVVDADRGVEVLPDSEFTTRYMPVSDIGAVTTVQSSYQRSKPRRYAVEIDVADPQ